MVNFKNGEVPANDFNLNKMQTDLQQEIATAKSGLEKQINETESTLNTNIQNHTLSSLLSSIPCCFITIFVVKSVAQPLTKFITRPTSI